jgi:hypothetical protein
LLVQIVASVKYEEIIGRFALIKAAQTKILFDRNLYRASKGP